jgi:hypothetical protein
MSSGAELSIGWKLNESAMATLEANAAETATVINRLDIIYPPLYELFRGA